MLKFWKKEKETKEMKFSRLVDSSQVISLSGKHSLAQMLEVNNEASHRNLWQWYKESTLSTDDYKYAGYIIQILNGRTL